MILFYGKKITSGKLISLRPVYKFIIVIGHELCQKCGICAYAAHLTLAQVEF